MKNILLLATGGTIACKTTENGLTPQISSEELLSYIPSAKNFCRVEAKQIMNLDSSNMQPSSWLTIVKEIETYYDHFDGFVIAHGTDTMAYTASALSYLIQDSYKPIVLTGAQKPIDEEMTDAKTNLLDSLAYASSEKASGVCVVFGNKVIAGTRARKMNTKSYDAFESINFPKLAIIHDQKIFHYFTEEKGEKSVKFFHQMDPKIFVMKLIPGADANVLLTLQDQYDAFVLESYGVGGLPEGEGYHFHEVVETLIRNHKTVVLTTQAIFEGSDIGVYHSGHLAKEVYGVLEAFDMTLEATVTKLMWILGQTKDPERIRFLFNQPMAKDMLASEN